MQTVTDLIKYIERHGFKASQTESGNILAVSHDSYGNEIIDEIKPSFLSVEVYLGY